MPDPRAFTTIAVVAAPIVCLMAGILEFVVLDGATAFPVLAISLAPFMIGAALLMTLPNQLLSALGRFNLIFTLALLAPSNPQTYNPQTFLFSTLFLLSATGLLFAAQILIPLVSNDHCRQWLQASVHRDLQRLPTRVKQALAPEEAMFRDADRIVRMLAAHGNAPEHRTAIQEVMANFDCAAVLRFCDAELDRLAQGPLRTEIGAAYTSLVKRDPTEIIASAHALKEAASVRDISAAGASAALTLASLMLTSPCPGADFSAEGRS